MEKYSNKRMMHRKGGKFAKLTASDFGIGGACPNCRHLLIRVYEGDPNNIDPRAFRYRCFTCEPKTEQELAVEAQKSEAQFSLSEFFEAAEHRFAPRPETGAEKSDNESAPAVSGG
jgi:hypothetical protein